MSRDFKLFLKFLLLIFVAGCLTLSSLVMTKNVYGSGLCIGTNELDLVNNDQGCTSIIGQIKGFPLGYYSSDPSVLNSTATDSGATVDFGKLLIDFASWLLVSALFLFIYKKYCELAITDAKRTALAVILPLLLGLALAYILNQSSLTITRTKGRTVCPATGDCSIANGAYGVNKTTWGFPLVYKTASSDVFDASPYTSQQTTEKAANLWLNYLLFALLLPVTALVKRRIYANNRY